MKKQKIIAMLIATIVINFVLPIRSAVPELKSTAYSNGKNTDPAPISKEFESNSATKEKIVEHTLKSDTTKVTSIGTNRNFGWADGGVTLDFEGFFGVRIDTTEPANPKYSVYTHNDYFTCNSISFNGKNLEGITKDEWYPLEIKGLEDDIYDIILTFKDQKGGKHSVTGYFGVENGKAYTCRRFTRSMESYSKTALSCLMRDLNPKDYLSTAELCYPTQHSYHCVKEYQKLADEIAKPNWTDEAKVYAFVKYIRDHYAYDQYKVRQNQSRASMADNYDDPNNFMYKNHVGVCWDFTNVLCIMCRHVGIPCTSLDNNHHTINAVYMNGEWVTIDVTALMVWECNSEDTNESNWYRTGSGNWSKYGNYEAMPYINYEIWRYGMNENAYQCRAEAIDK